MAKLALINREEKRAKNGGEVRRPARRTFCCDHNVKLSDEERMDARLKLQQLPATPVRPVSAIAAH